MLQKSTIARLYASSVLTMSIKFNVLEEVNTDFKMLKTLLHDCLEFRQLLGNPIINARLKMRIIDRILGGKIQPLIIKLLDILLWYDRGDIFEYLIEIFFELYIEEKGILPVKLISAKPMNEKEKAMLSNPIEEMTLKKVDFEESIDESLIGGFIVDFSVYRLDTSIRKSLEDYRKILSKGSF